MYHDAAASDFEFRGDYDLCIVGAGPAGISIAIEMARAGQRVCLLEAGGFDFEPESQEVYEAEMRGFYMPSADATRLRYFGGTTGHWGGQCFRFDPFDYDPKDYVDLTGWPVTFSDIDKHTARAEELVSIRSFNGIRRAFDDKGELDLLDQRWSSDRGFADISNLTPIRFGDYYRQAVIDNPGIDLVLHANLRDLHLDGVTGRITHAEIENYDGARHKVAAKNFVMAMGGIENSRLLRHFNRTKEDRLGNQGDMVGRCFMEHPVLRNGPYFITKRLYSHLPYWEGERLFYRQKPELLLSLSERAQRERKVLNACVHLDRMYRRPIDEEELEGADWVRSLEFDKDYFFTGLCWVVGEQAPNRNSRIALTDTADKFGIPRAIVDWQLLPIDLQSLRAASMAVATEFVRTGWGRVKLNDSLWNEDPEPEYDISFHHMGGTRMSETAETGVVDADCKVHGVGNLYVAGSSIFPTSGHANPTFTIVQFALRLAEHLRSA